MLLYNEIKERKYINIGGIPYEVVSSNVFRKQKRKPVNQTKLKNLLTGKILEKNFHQSEKVLEAEITSRRIKFLYANDKKGSFWFCDINNTKERFIITNNLIGNKQRFLKENEVYNGLVFNEKIISIKLPIKIELAVKDAPSGEKGNSVSSKTKRITLETGAVILAPLFIYEGDIVRINTDTGEYVERVAKK